MVQSPCDGRADIITGPGAGGGPHVRAVDSASGAELASFFAYDPAFQVGVRVAAGNIDVDGRADIFTAPGPGGGPHVRAFSGSNGAELASFFAYDPGFGGGVFVAGSRGGEFPAPAMSSAAPAGTAAVVSGAMPPGVEPLEAQAASATPQLESVLSELAVAVENLAGEAARQPGLQALTELRSEESRLAADLLALLAAEAASLQNEQRHGPALPDDELDDLFVGSLDDGFWLSEAAPEQAALAMDKLFASDLDSLLGV